MLEAVVIISIMISAVAFVVTFEQPQPPSFNAREGLEIKAQDVLDIMHDTPIDSNFGSNELSAFIAQCLNQQCTPLENKLEKLIPAGSSYAIYVSNGFETYPVLLKGSPRGEAVSATRTFEPDWSSTFVATATESIGTTDALLTYALPIFHSTPVTPGGSQIFVKVTGTRVSDGSDYVLIASAATSAQALNDPTAVAASLYFVDEDGDPLPVHDIVGPELVPQRLTLRLAETEELAAIPAGVEVTVHTPRGWTATAPQAENPDWTVTANADNKNGSYVGSAIRATLNAPLQDDVRDLVFDITYHGDVLDYYPLTASLSKGANAMASTILRGDEHSSVPALATPLLHMSVPGPMGHGAETTWTLGAYIPVNADSELPDELRSAIRVHKVELIEQEGNAIFGPTVDATAEEAMDGTWVSSGSSLVWTGEVLMDGDQALNLTFRVGASGVAGPSDMRSHFVPPVTFDSWSGRLVGRTGWGFYRQAILPEDDTYAGYDRTAGVESLYHPLESNGVYRQTTLPGSMEYSVSLAGAVQDSLYGSYVLAEERSVPLGGEVVISANVQSVLFALADAGQRAGVTIRFYAPWSGDEREPEWEKPMLDQGLLSGDVSQMVTLDINQDGFPDPIVGTTNGLVIAYDGRTGQRIQGNAYSVPSTRFAEGEQGAPKITQMKTIRLHGADHIVVGTDKNSDGLIVLDTDFVVRWTYVMPTDVLAIDTSTDFNADGQPEIVVARAYEVGTAKNAIVYVLSAPLAGNTLIPMPGKDPPIDAPDALGYTLGTPTTILAQSSGGPRGGAQAVMVPIQTNVDPGVQATFGTFPPTVTQGPSSTPRAGVQGFNEFGDVTGTLFGAPASVLRDYDYDGDIARDVLLGGASGYVIMASGETLTQPLYSYILAGSSKIVSGDARSSVEAYILTQDGTVIMTDDAWFSMYGPLQPAIGGKAISSNAFNSYWVVGDDNKVWRSSPPLVPEPEDTTLLRHPAARELLPVTMLAKRGAEDYDFVSHIHDFRDVHFRGSNGYIVGAVCTLPIVCGEPIMLRTTDGGANWVVLSSADGSLVNRHGLALDKNMSRIEIVEHDAGWTGWVVGDGGLIVRSLPGGLTWKELATDFTYDLRDIACLPDTPDTCWAVGDAGAAVVTYNARAEVPVWHDKTGLVGLPTDRPLLSVGFPEDSRGYIGSTNMVLASFDGSLWTTLPLNYVENDGYSVATAGDGGGWVFGGSDANARIWFLHDYHTQSQAQTTSFEDRFPADAHITSVELIDGNVTFAQQTILVNVTTLGGDDEDEWRTIGPLVPGDGASEDSRKPDPMSASWGSDYENNGRDFRARIVFNTTPDKTILSPIVRALTLRVNYVTPSVGGGWNPVQHEDISLDFTATTQVDHATAAWDVTLQHLRQPHVQEFWTRNVSGQVHDIQTGFDVVGNDGLQEVWVATGDVLSENSPDYIIYAGTDPERLMEKHNRVYLLNGHNGDPVAISPWLQGEVRQIRLVDTAPTGSPDILFAATANTTPGPTSYGKLYALHPTTLAELWSVDIGRELPVALELGKALPDGDPAALIGAARPADETSHAPHLWSIREDAPRVAWSVIPDDIGKYLIRKAVEPKWLYGPHVVEVAVEWEETVTEAQVDVNLEGLGGVPPPPDTPGGPTTPAGSSVLRAARFYDHFMVTPPDAVASPNPVYTARLLVWLDDWG